MTIVRREDGAGFGYIIQDDGEEGAQAVACLDREACVPTQRRIGTCPYDRRCRRHPCALMIGSRWLVRLCSLTVASPHHLVLTLKIADTHGCSISACIGPNSRTFQLPDSVQVYNDMRCSSCNSLSPAFHDLIRRFPCPHPYLRSVTNWTTLPLLRLLHAVPSQTCHTTAEHTGPSRAAEAIAGEEGAGCHYGPERVRCKRARERRALVALAASIDISDKEELPVDVSSCRGLNHN